MPTEEQERQREDNHWNADAVRKLIQRMLVFGSVSFKQIGGHNFRYWALVFSLRSWDLAFVKTRSKTKGQRPKTQFITSTNISIVPPQTIPSSLASPAVSEKWWSADLPERIASRASAQTSASMHPPPTVPATSPF